MKIINIRTPGGASAGFTINCREAAVARMVGVPRGPLREMKATLALAKNFNILRNRVGRVNSVLKEHPEFEKIKIVTDEKRLIEEGPRCSAQNGFYLELGQLADYLPVLHGVLGFLRGGKTMELALAKASIGVCNHLAYDEDLEGKIPFNGAQSFLKNTWPGLWAGGFAEATKRYRAPYLDIVFATFLAHHMGWTKDIEVQPPWGIVGKYRITVDAKRLSPSTRGMPTYFFNSIRTHGKNRYGEAVASSLGYISLREQFRGQHVCVVPDEIFQQIPFFGKPEEKGK